MNDGLLCGKRDLNPYGVNHTPLKRARLPVPPLSHLLPLLRPLDYYIISLRKSQYLFPFFLNIFLGIYFFNIVC